MLFQFNNKDNGMVTAASRYQKRSRNDNKKKMTEEEYEKEFKEKFEKEEARYMESIINKEIKKAIQKDINLNSKKYIMAVEEINEEEARIEHICQTK